MVLEEREEEIAFPASANAGDDFDQMVVFGLYQMVQNGVAFDLHDNLTVSFDVYVNVN